MASRRQKETDTGAAPTDPLDRALAAVIADARMQVRAGRRPDRKALAARVRGAAERRRAEVGEEAVDDVVRAERAALKQLERVVAVHQAYRRLAQPLAAPVARGPAAPAGPRRFGGFRARPTITGTLDVRRAESDGTVTLSWEPLPAVKTWEVRFSRKADPRGDYVQAEALTLPPGVTSVALPLDDRQLRVNVIGQARDGRPVRRVLISALTADNWNDRWERRATAS